MIWDTQYSHMLQVECEIVTAILQNFLLVTCEVKYIQLYKPEISLLGIHPREMNAYVHKKTCIGIFMATFLIIDKNWKQPQWEKAYIS